MNKIIWKKKVHVGWKETMRGNVFYKWHYEGFVKDEKIYSIIGPSIVTFDMWEAYMGNKTPRFETLKEAKNYCEKWKEF